MSQKPQAQVRQFLLSVVVPRERSELLVLLARTAASFFDIAGGAERQDVGRFVRAGRGNASEVLDLVRFAVAERSGDDPLTMARRLETVLRSAIEVIGADAVTAKVFLSNAEAAP